MRISDWSSDVCSSVLDSSSQAQPLAQVDQDRSGYAPYAPILPHDLIIGPLTALELNPAPDLIIRVQRIFQRHFEPVRHFMFVGNKGKSGRNDAQHRRNLKAGVGAEAIRYTNNVDLIARHGEFLFGLTQGSVGHILVSVVHPAAGKGYLSCMFA